MIRAILTSGSMRSLRQKPDRSCATKPGHISCHRHVETDEVDFGAYLNYLHFGEATLTFPQTLILRYARFEPSERRLPQAAADYARWFLSRLRTLVPLLDKQEFLCASRFTAADVSVGYALL